MLNIMKSELEKIMHRRCTYVFLVIFVLGSFFINLLMHVVMTSNHITDMGNKAMEFWTNMAISFGWFIVFMIAQIIYSNESRIGVLKNSISFGISRAQMYVGRFLTQLLVLIGTMVILSASVLLGNLVFNGGCSMECLHEFLMVKSYMLLLWIGALSLSHMLSSCLNSNSAATVIYMLYFFFVNSILEMARMALPHNHIIAFLNKYEIFLFASRVAKEDHIASNLLNYFLIGSVYFAVCFGVGLFIYKRKEVK